GYLSLYPDVLQDLITFKQLAQVAVELANTQDIFVVKKCILFIHDY
ncbi:MAG: hypothetical protein XE06_0734, partial [Anaerolineaceae bacterium 46_22]